MSSKRGQSIWNAGNVLSVILAAALAIAALHLRLRTITESQGAHPAAGG